LAIGQFGCVFYSNIPHIDLDYGCRSSKGTSTTNSTNSSSPEATTKDIAADALLVISPNPATETAVATYNIGTHYKKATVITVYDLKGAQHLKQALNNAKGEVQLNISHLAAGTYIVTLQADGTTI